MLSLLRTWRRLTGSTNPEATPEIISPGELNTEAPLEVPGRWGHLVLRELIGHGAFGAVYRAFDPALDREVALKLLSKAETRGAGSKCIDEGRLLAKLRHPNIAIVFGADVRDGQAGIWMEHIRGRTLQELVSANGPFSAREVALIGIELAQAVAAVHAARVLHRDIKAANVMRETGGRLVLVDFGLGLDAWGARAVDIAGTPAYMAPELLRGDPPSPCSEVFAIGATLYFLSTGLIPQNGCALREVRPGLPEALLEVVEGAMQNDPAMRPQSAARISKDLQIILSGASTKRPLLDRRGLAVRIGATIGLTTIAIPAGWLAFRTTPRGVPTIWVAPTEIKTEIKNEIKKDSVSYKGLRDALRLQIKQSAYAKVFDEVSIQSVLQRMGLPRDVAVEGSVRREVARRLDVTHLIDSTVHSPGGETRLTVWIQSLNALPFLSSQRTQREFFFEDGSSMWKAVRDAGEWARSVVLEPPAEIASNTRLLRDATTNNLEALHHYSLGEHYQALGKDEDAATEWKSAVHNDPGFIQAIMRLGDIAKSHGREMESIEYYSKASALLGQRKLDPREEMRTRASILYDTGDIMAADVVHASWSARYPLDFEPRVRRANPLMETDRPREALAILREAVELAPYYKATPRNIAMCHLMLGELDKVEPATTSLRDLGDKTNADLLDATVLYFRGDAVAALKGMADVWKRTRRDSKRVRDRIDAVLAIASLHSDLGQNAKALEIIEQDLHPSESFGDPPLIAMEYAALAELRLATDQKPEARAAAELALRDNPGPDILRRAGPVMVRTGAINEARLSLSTLEARFPKGEAKNWRIYRLPGLLIEGEILLETGKKLEGLRMLQSAALLDRPGRPKDYLVRAYIQNGDIASALEGALQIAMHRGLYWRMPSFYPCGIWRWGLDSASKLSVAPAASHFSGGRIQFVKSALDRLNRMASTV